MKNIKENKMKMNKILSFLPGSHTTVSEITGLTAKTRDAIKDLYISK
jgi:hypothetical protein